MIGTEAQRLEYLDSLYPVWPGDTLWTFFESRAERYPDRPCLFYQDDVYTYSRMDDLIRGISRSLYAHGVRPGDHVAVAMYNTPLHYGIIFALSRLCAVRIPLNMQMKEESRIFVLRQSAARWLIGTGLLEFDISGLDAQKAVIPCDNEQIFLNTGNRVSDLEIDRAEAARRDPSAVGDILYTSGSTSFPKGVRIRQDAILRSSYATARTRRMEDGRRIFVPVPFYHVFAWSEGILASLHVYGSIVISDRKYSPMNTLYLMRKHAASDLICVPLVAIELLDALPEFLRKNSSAQDTSGEGGPSVKKGSGTVPFPALHAAFISPAGPDWLWDRFRDAFCIRDITTGYGMTECGATSTLTSPGDPAEILKRSAGRLKEAGIAGMTADYPHLLHIRICDPETGRELPPGSTGEIVCKGLTVTPGYLNNPEANHAAFSDGGWFHTGDLGTLDDSGLLRFDGRKNDMYKTNGENVSPLSVELKISQCPGVIQAELVGIPHDKYGEVGVAFIDAGRGNVRPESQRGIQEWCRAQLASFQVPLYYIFEDQSVWPRSATEKVQKEKLRRRALALVKSGDPLCRILPGES